jgi:hypothetical protein
LYRATKAGSYLEFAERIANFLVARAEVDGNGMKWTQADWRIAPDNLVAQTGLMQGAASIGLFLVRFNNVRCGRKASYLFVGEADLWYFAYDLRSGSCVALAHDSLKWAYTFANAKDMVNDMLTQTLGYSTEDVDLIFESLKDPDSESFRPKISL